MTAQDTIPPNGDEVRTMVKARLAEAQAGSDGGKVTVTWRNSQKHLDVISMPVNLLRLNPETHRIRAQRSVDPVRDQQLTANPWSPESQDYLRFLLSSKPSNPDQTDPDFITLTEELKESGQREPGIISPDGILVDGNTRCIALRELGLQEILVGVLPGDTTWQDINAVELRLQLRKDKRRDYTYINRLIAIDEQLRNGRLADQVANDFNIKPKTLEGDQWVYAVVREAIERSADGDMRLRLIDFEEHQEKLRELWRDFDKAHKTDPDAAERLKESRLQAILLGHSKTTVRLIEQDFHDRYVEARLPVDLQTEQDSDSDEIAVPGLDVTVDDVSNTVKAAKALTDKLLRAKAITAPGAGATAAQTEAAEKTIRKAVDVFEVATHLAGKNDQLKKRQIAVPQRISDAAEDIQQCVAEYAQAKAQRALDEDALDDALLELRAQMQRLAKLAARGGNQPGEGVAWLLDIVRDRV